MFRLRVANWSDGQRERADGHQSIFVVADIHVPHRGRATDVKRHTRSGDVTLAHSSDVIDVELDPHDEMARSDGEGSPEGCDRLTERCRRPTMEETVGLRVPGYRHACHDPVGR